jgi:hypothetical protein
MNATEPLTAWKPHRYSSEAAQNRNPEMLLNWVCAMRPETMSSCCSDIVSFVILRSGDGLSTVASYQCPKLNTSVALVVGRIAGPR